MSFYKLSFKSYLVPVLLSSFLAVSSVWGAAAPEEQPTKTSTQHHARNYKHNVIPATRETKEHLKSILKEKGGSLIEISGGVTAGASATLPTSDLRNPLFSNIPIQDQGSEESCVGFSGAAATSCYFINEEKQPPIQLSTTFLWTEAKSKEGTLSQNVGVQIPDALAILVTQGICPATQDPDTAIDEVQLPSDQAIQAAKAYIIPANSVVSLPEPSAPNFLSVATQLLTQNHPIWMGIQLFEASNWFVKEWETIVDGQWEGQIVMPGSSDSSIGGHAILIVGFDGTNFIFRNSWGTGWGKGGYGFIPQAYLCQHGFNPFVFVPSGASFAPVNQTSGQAGIGLAPASPKEPHTTPVVTPSTSSHHPHSLSLSSLGKDIEHAANTVGGGIIHAATSAFHALEAPFKHGHSHTQPPSER